ncbi:MAG: glycosyltransferase family 39 protein [Methanosarcinales archaeon]|nr:glycosyltransferase family 39 protein [Methanosarcinales archaeon]
MLGFFIYILNNDKLKVIKKEAGQENVEDKRQQMEIGKKDLLVNKLGASGGTGAGVKGLFRERRFLYEVDFKKVISYVFLGLLLLIAVHSILPETMPGRMVREYVRIPLVVATIVLGVVTFYLNRDMLYDIEDESRQEEIAKRKREAEFTQRYPKVNRLWGVRWIARWMYKERGWYSVVLIGILILASILRLNQISTLDYWIDEYYSMIIAQTILDGTYPILPSGYVSHRAVIYFNIIACSIKIFGFNQFAGRIPNLIFTGLIILSLYFIGRNLFNKSVGIVSAFLFSISPLAIHMAREIRMYEMTAFLSLILIGLGYLCMDRFNTSGKPIMEFLYNKLNITFLIFFSFIILLTLETHISTMSLLFSFYACFFYYYLIKKNKHYRFIILLCLFMLPIFIVVGYKSFNIIEGFLYLSKTALGLNRPDWTTTYCSWGWHFLNLIENSGLIPIVFIGLLYSIFSYKFFKNNKDKTVFLMLAVSIPLIFVSIPRIDVARYSYFLLPIFILFISNGIIILYKFIAPIFLKTNYSNIFIILILIVFIVSNIYIGYDASNHPKWAKTVNFKKASEIIKSNSNQNTTVIFNYMAAPTQAHNINPTYFFVEKQIKYYNEYNGSHKMLGTKYLTFHEFKNYIENNHDIIVAIRPWPADITDVTFTFLEQNMKRINEEKTHVIIYYKK